MGEKLTGIPAAKRRLNSMKQRCYNRNNSSYYLYGGRGIKICDRWMGKDGAELFFQDMGDCPNGMSIDRSDNNGPYSPENCKWATRSQQVRNQRPRIVERQMADGVRKTWNYVPRKLLAYIASKGRKVELTLVDGTNWSPPWAR